MQYQQPEPNASKLIEHGLVPGPEIGFITPDRRENHPHKISLVQDFLAEFVEKCESETGVDREIYQTCAYLREYSESLSTSAEFSEFREAVERQVVELLNHEKFYFAVVLLTELPTGEEVKKNGELYSRAVQYALDGLIRYGDLTQAAALIPYLSDVYLAQPATHEALEARLRDILRLGDSVGLSLIQALVDNAPSSIQPGLRTDLVCRYRAEAEQRFLEDPISPFGAALRDFFWLEEWLESSEAQEIIAVKMGECLEGGLLLEAAEFVQEVPLSLETLQNLRSTVDRAVRVEKAKIAAGYYEDVIFPLELALMVQEPLNLLVKTFDLPEALLESVTLSE